MIREMGNFMFDNCNKCGYRYHTRQSSHQVLLIFSSECHLIQLMLYVLKCFSFLAMLRLISLKALTWSEMLFAR